MSRPLSASPIAGLSNQIGRDVDEFTKVLITQVFSEIDTLRSCGHHCVS